MRNLIVLALFRAYGEVFRSNAIIAIEEPEIYLHPHAQRSLSSLFELLTSQGAQLFLSTHSAAFLSPDRADRIVRVRQLPDEEDELCTQIRHIPPQTLLGLRQQLRPGVVMSVSSMQERYRNICTVEHCEAFFASCVILVEGPTERAALPIYGKHLNVDFNDLGISVVNASGKGNLDAFYHLYSSMEIPVFVVFDNDRNGELRDQNLNSVLMKMLGQPEEQMPAAVCTEGYCVLDCNYEVTVRADVEAIAPSLYAQLRQEAVTAFGDSKPIVARYMARKLVDRDIVPQTVRRILASIKDIVCPSAQEEQSTSPVSFDDDDIPF